MILRADEIKEEILNLKDSKSKAKCINFVELLLPCIAVLI